MNGLSKYLFNIYMTEIKIHENLEVFTREMGTIRNSLKFQINARLRPNKTIRQDNH